MSAGILPFGNEAMGFIKNDEQWLLSPTDRKILGPEQHVIDDPEHRSHNHREHLGRKAGYIEDRDRSIVSNPISYQ